MADLAHLRAAGAERIGCSWRANGGPYVGYRAYAFAKNQADLLYFSGHGYASSGRISHDWLSAAPATVQPSLNWREELECVTLAACTVLNIVSLTGYRDGEHSEPVDGHGRMWADACIAGRNGNTGEIEALCGYWGSAPADSGGKPQDIAARFGSSCGPGQWVDAWMNANDPASVGVGVRACAMDKDKYKWWKKVFLGKWQRYEEEY